MFPDSFIKPNLMVDVVRRGLVKAAAPTLKVELLLGQPRYTSITAQIAPHRGGNLSECTDSANRDGWAP
ncbi:hypothetical protein [Streptomyces sp. NPDC003710]